MKKFLFRFLILFFTLPLLLVSLILLNNELVTLAANGRIYNDISDVPYRKYTLVLGSGNSQPGLWDNKSFDYRMEATTSLYKNKKTTIIIASGISNQIYYNEPNEMKRVLVENGIPGNIIYPDHGGMRTWASLLRAHNHYKADTIIIVSQVEQLERAILSAKCQGIDAIGFTADPLPYTYRFWTFREYLARVKCVWDCIVFSLKIA